VSPKPEVGDLIAELRALDCVTPALVIDLDQVERNIAAMLRAVGDPVRWRPHVKTVKQPRIVELLVDAGVRHFKCATIPELAMTLGVGTRRGLALDVLLAYPVARARLREVASLARTHGCRIGVTADDPAHCEAIAEAPGLDPWLDVDVGMHRTGTSLTQWRVWLDRAARPEIVGIQAYEGHIAWEADADAVYDGLGALARSIDTVQWLLTSGSLAFAAALRSTRLAPDPAHGDRWRHQIGPGTLVLGDVASTAPATAIGAAPAAFVVARVVSRPSRDRVTLDAGSKALSPDRPAPNCRVVGHPDWRARTPSEEHLPLDVDPDEPIVRDDLVLLVPDHVCTTVNLHRRAIYVRGAKIVETGEIAAAGRESPLGAIA
jgi:D-serine deaminase-like pyridoxal phosphate-dependent protein